MWFCLLALVDLGTVVIVSFVLVIGIFVVLVCRFVRGFLHLFVYLFIPYLLPVCLSSRLPA